MNLRIIYQNDNGGVSIITPCPEIVEAFGIQAIAEKDVPPGKPYKIIDVAELPADRTFRGAWVVDEQLLDDGVGATHDTFDTAGANHTPQGEDDDQH